MRKYARYKDSGISWIGDVPEHWECCTLRKYLTFVSDKGHPDEQLLSVTREQGVIIRNKESKEENHNFIPEDLSGYKLVKKGQFAINKMKSWQGSYAVSEYTGIVSPAYYICDLRFDYKPFFNLAIRSKAYIPFFTIYSKGIRVDQWDLSPIGLKSIPFFQPPLSEQKAIAEYLDKKTAQINELVSAKQKQIELLKEYKQSVIANAVTGKIDERREKRKWKDSGISWIGKIPENWEIKRAKFMFKKEKRDVRDSDDVVTCFRDGEVTLRKNRRTSGFTESITEIGYQGIRKNDLVIHQMDAFAGAIGVSDSDGKGTSVYHCCTPLGNYDVRYYAHLLREMAKKGYIQSLYRGIRERSSDFNFQVFGKQYLVVPPLSEQKAIAEYLDKKTAQINELVSAKQKQIELLKEYKQSVIANAVTGKLNKNCRMKDSGVSWIGKIPENWEVDKLGHRFIQRKEKVSDKDYPPLSVSKMGVTPQLESACKTDDGDNRKLVLKGDFVVNSRSDRKGSCGLSELDGSVSLINIIATPRNIDGHYIHYLFRSSNYIEEFYRMGRGIVADLWTTRWSEMRTIMIPVPPLSEQKEIVAYIEKKVSSIDSQIASIENQIANLNEYKQSLISDVVTGKVKVF